MEPIIWIAALTFLLRALPRFLGVKLEGGDQTAHLLMAREIRRNRFKLPVKIKGFLLPGIYDYPPLFHYLLAVFPDKSREQIAPFVSAFIDTVHVTVIYFFAIYLIQFSRLSPYLEDTTWVAAIAALLFATSPALLYFGIGPRAFQATPRTLGELFITLTFFLGLVYYVEGSYLAFLLASFFAALSLLTSKFGGQVLIFFSIGLATLLMEPELLLLPILGVGFALVLTKGHYWKVLIGWIKHSILYKTIMIKNYNTYIDRNTLVPFRGLANAAKKLDARGFALSLRDVLTNNSYIILLIRNPILSILLILSILHAKAFADNGTFMFLGAWVVVSLLTFFITSLRPFIFLGEAERYIEHSIPAQVILLSFLLFPLPSPSLLIGLLAYQILIYIPVIIWIYVVYKKGAPARKVKADLFNWLIAQGITGKRILSIPGDYNQIIYRTGNWVLLPPGNLTLIDKDKFESLWEVIPWPNRDIARLIADYQLEYIIVLKSGLTYALERGWKYEIDCYHMIYENEHYAVYRAEA